MPEVAASQVSVYALRICLELTDELGEGFEGWLTPNLCKIGFLKMSAFIIDCCSGHDDGLNS